MKRVVFNRYRYLAEQVQGKKLLDLGCAGDGGLADKRNWLHDYLRVSASTTLGLDSDARKIEQLAQDGYDVVHGDASAFSLPERFDVIVAAELIEHLSNPGLFLDCVSRHLTAGGELIVTTPNATSLIFFLQTLVLGREIDNPFHVALYTQTKLKNLLERHGFEVIRSVFLCDNIAGGYPKKYRWLGCIQHVFQLLVVLIRPSVCFDIAVTARLRHQQRNGVELASGVSKPPVL